jgi:hypothetical protein
LHIIRSQLGAKGTVFDIEYNNHTSFYFKSGLPGGSCRAVTFDVVREDTEVPKCKFMANVFCIPHPVAGSKKAKTPGVFSASHHCSRINPLTAFRCIIATMSFFNREF